MGQWSKVDGIGDLKSGGIVKAVSPTVYQSQFEVPECFLPRLRQERRLLGLTVWQLDSTPQQP